MPNETVKTGKCRACGAPSCDEYGGRKCRQYVRADRRKMPTGEPGVVLEVQVGDRIEVCKACFRRWKRTGSMERVNRRAKDLREVEAPKLRALLDAGLSTRQIAAAFAVSYSTVQRWLAALERGAA